MVSYIKAFQEGLEAADAADRAKREIDEIFANLNKEIDQESHGKLGIKRDEYEKTKTNYHPVAGIPVRAKERYFAIVAYNPEYPERVKELARWKQEKTGYPCTISWDNGRHICEDKEALEITLAELLKDPEVGWTLKILMKMPSKQFFETNEEDCN